MVVYPVGQVQAPPEKVMAGSGQDWHLYTSALYDLPAADTSGWTDKRQKEEHRRGQWMVADPLGSPNQVGLHWRRRRSSLLSSRLTEGGGALRARDHELAGGAGITDFGGEGVPYFISVHQGLVVVAISGVSRASAVGGRGVQALGGASTGRTGRAIRE